MWIIKFIGDFSNKLVKFDSAFNYGNRAKREIIFPNCLFDVNCPISFKREFIAAYFGADGMVPVLSYDKTNERYYLSCPRIIFCKKKKFVESMKICVTKFAELMQENWGIIAEIEGNGYETSHSQKNYNGDDRTYAIRLAIRNGEIFNAKIGVRYCVHKLQRMAGAAAYWNYRNGMETQWKKIMKAGNILMNKGDLTLKESYNTAITTFTKRNAILGDKSIPTFNSFKTAYYRKTINHSNPQFGNKTFIKDWFDSVNITSWFRTSEIDMEIDSENNEHKISDDEDSDNSSTTYAVPRDLSGLPVFKLKIINIQEIESCQVYDITVEKPYHSFVANGVIVHNCNDMKYSEILLNEVIESYNLLSTKYFTHATPTLFNAATPHPQLSSCFLLTMIDDSIDGIYETLKQCAMISKHAGGIGVAVGNIRAAGSYIKGTNGTSNGLVPMLRVFNMTARYVDQGNCYKNTYIYAMNF
jgi:hypothetical protein